MARPRKTTVDVLMRFVSPEPNSGCWLWTAGVGRGDYGRVRVGSLTQYAHRVSYELFRGPIPAGMVLDHLCRVHCCVNPAHLEAVTQWEYIRRGETAKAMLDKTHCPAGHPYSADNTYMHRGRHCRICRRDAVRRNDERRRNGKAA